MKKLIMLAAILALAVAIAVPAIAQSNRFDNDDRFDRFDNGDAGVNFANEQEAESGGFSADFSVTNEGDYASQCVPAQQFGNTGNFNNAPSFLQYGSESGDFEPGGIEVSFSPEQAVECSNSVEQSSAASG
jgi:hypothetical protein